MPPIDAPAATAPPDPHEYPCAGEALREGVTVVIRTDQKRMGGPKYPGRSGRVIRRNWLAAGYWTVELDATARARARVELFSGTDLLPQPRQPGAPPLPPEDGASFAARLEAQGKACLAGRCYVLAPVPHPALSGWIVMVEQAGELVALIGAAHPLTRSLAVHCAADDAMHWWLVERQPDP